MVGCEVLQERFGLSDRETKSPSFGSRLQSPLYQKLFISKNTVATHIRHIYGKLDIHSKESLST